MAHFTLSTRSLGDGSEACYVVYFERQIVATFPINDPTSPDARYFAKRFIAMEEPQAYCLRPEPEMEMERRR